MGLQQFVTKAIENLGGVVIPVEYALCNVLIPEEYAPYFQNKTELDLAFDFEVAQENPDSDFVTFGSYVLEQLLLIVQKKAKTARRYIEIDRLELANPEQKMTEFLGVQGTLTIESQRPVFGIWAVFHYYIAFITDEKRERKSQVWVNLLTNEIDMTMQQAQNQMMYVEKSSHIYPIPAALDMESAFEKATDHIKEACEKQKNEDINHQEIAKDIGRINQYYDELLTENHRRSNRKGLSEVRRKEISERAEAIQLERDKQLQEIYSKASGQTEINLDHAILYFVPLLEYNIVNHFRGSEQELVVLYNPVTKGFDCVKDIVL